jgi:hypothetical protein
VVDLVSLVSNSDQRLDKNLIRNMLSQSNMIFSHIPKHTQTCSNKSLTEASTVIFFLQAIRMAMLEK